MTTITTYPAEVLSCVSGDVPNPTSDLCRQLVAVMRTTAAKAHGIGLAACQIGIATRLFVMLEPDGTFLAVANPTLTLGHETDHASEGCLSLPGGLCQVERATTAHLSGIDVQTGEAFERHLWGLQAVIAQHECDHLGGRLIIDRVSRQQRRMVERAVAGKTGARADGKTTAYTAGVKGNGKT